MEIFESALGLKDKASAYVRQLSGGMKRRLLVAKAMVHAPPILILDEPTAGVDIELRRQLWDYVMELNARDRRDNCSDNALSRRSAGACAIRLRLFTNGDVVACEPTEKLIASLDRKTLDGDAVT